MRNSMQEIVDGIVTGSLDDAEVLEWLSFIFENGLNNNETIELTESMRDSGDVFEWPNEWAHLVVDKHSTGGVGDKVSIPLAPALAACGLKVPMISGRGLGHTGGTLDKLESIPGFDVELDSKQIQDQIGNIGVAMVGQSENLVPADRRMYALRDISGTIASIPLITSSIVSKKTAEGLSALILDVKHGRAAFMQEREDAEALAHSMVDAANGMGVSTTAVLTTMDQPLGCAVGNSLEIVESVETLCGRGPHDLEELICVQGGLLLTATGISENMEEGALMIHDSLNDGSALKKFIDMVEAQGGDGGIFDSDMTMLRGLNLLDSKLNSTEIFSEKSGYVSDIDAMVIALSCCELGSGRKKLGDSIDHSVGAIIEAQVGDEVEEGDSLVVVYHRDELPNGMSKSLESAFTITDGPIELHSRVSEIIR